MLFLCPECFYKILHRKEISDLRFCFQNLDIVHVDNVHDGTSEEKIKQKLHQVDIDFRDEPGIIVLISGSRNPRWVARWAVVSEIGSVGCGLGNWLGGLWSRTYR